MRFLPTHNCVTLCIGHLEDSKLHIFQMLTQLIQNETSHFLVALPIWAGESINKGKLSSS